MKIYKENLKAQTITVTQFRELCKKYHYNGSSPGDIDMVIKFFKSAKDESKILFTKIVVYARKIDPSYGKDTGAEGDTVASKQA